MGMKIKYVGPKDHKRYNGQLFPRLLPVEVSNTEAAKMLAFPDVFLPADMDVPAETLAQREKMPDALIAEGQARVDTYSQMKAIASTLPHGTIVKETGKPDWQMQKRLDAMQGAQDEINVGNDLIKQGEALRVRLAAEAALAAAEPDKPKKPKAEAAVA